MSTVVEFPPMETFADHVAANIRAEAARRGVTQTDLARYLGLTQSVISLRYRGKREWSLNEIEAVARYLRTTTSALCAIRDSNPEPAGLEPRTVLRRLLHLGRRRQAPAETAPLAPVIDLAARRAERAA